MFEEDSSSDNKIGKKDNENESIGFDLEEDFAPVLPQQEELSKEEQDLQKELEAKFDELFGPIDEED